MGADGAGVLCFIVYLLELNGTHMHEWEQWWQCLRLVHGYHTLEQSAEKSQGALLIGAYNRPSYIIKIMS